MKILSENRRARFDYDLSDTLEAGIELFGFEVKSVKKGKMNLAGSYAIIKSNEAWLLNAEIPAFQPKNAPAEFDPKRTRRLLLHASEIKSMAGRLHEKGLTLLPLRAYLKNSYVKLELGLGKSRKKADKREVLKKRSAEREMRTRE